MQYSLQEIFNIIWKHFVTNKNGASVRFSHSTPGLFLPLYKANENTKCTIGVLIPDNLYKKSFEGKNVEHLLKDKNIKELFSLVNKDQLKTLQKIHDWSIESEIYGSTFSKEIEKRLINFAKTYHLDINL